MNALSSIRTGLHALTLGGSAGFLIIACAMLPGYAYAGLNVYIQNVKNSAPAEASGLYQCPNGSSAPNTIPDSCQFKPGITAKVGYKIDGNCAWNQPLHVGIIKVVNTERSWERENIINRQVFNSAAIDETQFNLPTEPGTYILNASIAKESHTLGSCNGDDAYRWFQIKPPTISPVSAEIKETNGGEVTFSSSQSVYYIPYSRTGSFQFITKRTDNSADLNIMKSCDVSVAPADIQAGRVKSNDSVVTFNPNDAVGVAIIHPQFIKPGERISIQSSCTMAGGGFPDKKAPNDPAIVIQRNEASFGHPHFTLGVNNDGTTTSPAIPDRNTQIDWQSNVKYSIGIGFTNRVTVPESCSYDGTTVDARSDMLTEDARKGTKNYENYTFSRNYSGNCYIGNGNSPYNAYPYQEAIDNSFTLIRNKPRISTQASFSGSAFGAATPDGQTTKLRPGENVTFGITAKLSGKYPNAEVRVAPDNNLLESKICPDNWKQSGQGCAVSLDFDSSSSGRWTLKADDSLMERTTASINMHGNNHELNEESGSLDLASKNIVITPTIAVGAQLDAVDPATLAKKVFHYGREFSVDMDYRFSGKTPQGTDNTKYQGALTGLTVEPEKGLQAAKVSSTSGSIAVGNVAGTVNSLWQGDSKQGFVSGQPALEHDQVIHLRVPVKVVQETRGTANISVLGSFSPSNVDIAPDSPTLLANTVSIALGDKLLPAEDVYTATVNGNRPLVVSQNSREQLLEVDFASKLKAAALMTGVISGTEMHITLPQGLVRSREGDNPLVLLCNGADCSKKLNNAWQEGSTASVLKDFALEPDVKYQLKVPVTLQENTTLEPNSQVTVSLTQSQELIDQDTKERVVTWVENGAPSALVLNKAMQQETRGKVTSLSLMLGDPDNAGSATLADSTHFNLRVNIVGAIASDVVTLIADGQSYAMTPSGAATADSVPYVAKNIPIPNKLDYPLSFSVHPTSGADTVLPLIGKDTPYDKDPRQLACSTKIVQKISTATCTLYWGGDGTPIPYAASDALLSIQSMKNAGVLTGAVDDLMKNMKKFNVKSKVWNDAVLFKQDDWKTSFPAPDFKKITDVEKSIMETGQGPLPIKGKYIFVY